MKNHNRDQEVCSVCEAQPQDMLILSCRHNLCLDCATQVYNLNSKEDKIICEICLSDTQLDQDTIVCLRSLSAKQINQSRREGIQYVHMNKEQNRQVFPPKSIKNTAKKNIMQIPLIIEEQSSQIRCDKHNETLTYYCMDCNNFRICSQCMLLDNHRFHKVVTLKKATIQVKQTIQKVIRQKQRLKNMLQKDKQSLLIRKQQSQKQLQVNINELKQTFQEIDKMIVQRYNQLCKNIEEQGSRKLQIMEGAVNQIQQKISLIQETIQFQEELIQSTIKSNHNIQNAMQMFQYYEKQITQNRLDFQPSLPNFISQVTPAQLYQKQQLFAQLQSLLQDFKITSAHQIPQEINHSQEQINYISQIDNTQHINFRQREIINLKQRDNNNFRQRDNNNFKQRDNNNFKQRENNLKQREIINFKQREDPKTIQIQKQKQMQRSFNKNKYQQQQLYSLNNKNSQTNTKFYPTHISQNINIIQLNSNKPNNNNLVNKPYNKQSNFTQPKVSKQTVQGIKKKVKQNITDRQLSQSRKMQLSRSIQNATDILNKIQQRTSKI